MAIYKGDKEIVGLYKGPTEIIKRYKGSNLIYESLLPYSFEYLYNSLIPTTINNKTVKDKLRLNKIYGNSVVENQQFQIYSTDQTRTLNGITMTDNRDGSYTFNGTATAETILSMGVAIPDINIGDKYLIFGGARGGSSTTYFLTQNSGGSSANDYGNGAVYTQPDNQYGRFLCVVIRNGVTVNNLVVKPQHISLTQWYPFNTPTTLTDTRVQEIINRGYIPYNTGELKSVDIGEISSEPYNLLSLNRTAGTYTGNRLESRGFDESHYYIGVSMNDYTTNGISNVVITENSVTMTTTGGGGYGIGFPVKVIPGQRYSLDIGGSTQASVSKRVGFYNENKEYISFAENMTGLGYCDVPFNAHWAVIIICPAAPTPGLTVTITDIAFHKTGTRTGYAPHTQPHTLPFIYQGSGVGASHDTMEDGGTEWIFTKDRALVDLGSLTYAKVQTANGYCFYGDLHASKLVGVNVVANLLCQKYSADTYARVYNNTTDKTIARQSDGQNIVIYDSAFNEKTPEEVKVLLSGIPLEYQLATPQVTRIPRKHLAVVDLGTLTWGSAASYGAYSSSLNQLAKKPSNNNTTPNIYCSKYTSSYRSQYGLNNRMLITIDQTGDLDIEQSDLIGLTNKQIQALLGGIYLFYETQDEVADIISDINIEAGGTLTSNLSSWIENQLVANGNFETNASGWGGLQGTNSVSDNTLTFTAANTVTNTGCYTQVLANGTTANHKYLVSAKIKASVSTTTTRIVFDGVYNDNPIFPLTADTWLDFSRIYSVSTPNTSTGVKGYLYFYYSQSGEEVASGSTLSVKKVMCIDLTLAFGAGKEPTSVNDPRIQYIIKQGYIPTNTTGTTKTIASKVLPNLDASFNRK